MVELEAGTYPYRNRHAIMDAVQAGLLPHTRQAGDENHLGCVTVLVRVTAPQEQKYVGRLVTVLVADEAGPSPEREIAPDVVPAWDFGDAARERAEHWERTDKIVPPGKVTP